MNSEENLVIKNEDKQAQESLVAGMTIFNFRIKEKSLTLKLFLFAANLIRYSLRKSLFKGENVDH